MLVIFAYTRRKELAMVLGLVATVVAVSGLPELSPCSAGGRGGQWGVCANGHPVILRGANYIRLSGSPQSKAHKYHSTFDS